MVEGKSVDVFGTIEKILSSDILALKLLLERYTFYNLHHEGIYE